MAHPSIRFPLAALLLVALAFLQSAARAEMAPEVYREMQDKAPEAIAIRVGKSTATRLGTFDFSGDRNVLIAAEVLSVTRTESGLKKGDKIVIRYVHRHLGKAAGPSPIPILEAGKSHPAWLRKSAEGHYEPAARGFSFKAVK